MRDVVVVVVLVDIKFNFKEQRNGRDLNPGQSFLELSFLQFYRNITLSSPECLVGGIVQRRAFEALVHIPFT